MRIARTLILIMGLLLAATPVGAQSPEEQRVDQALQHLSGYLGMTLTRQNTVWQWVRGSYLNAMLGCPEPGRAYPDNPMRSYDITIAVEGQGSFQYYVAEDGAIVILCLDGRPHPSSIGVEVEGVAVTTAPSEALNLPPADWWVVTQVDDQLQWVNPDGPFATLPRPRLNNETAPGAMRIAPDGRYLVATAPLSSGNTGLAFFDLSSGGLIQQHEAQPGEQIWLGDFDASTSTVAVGLAVMDGASHNWRVIVFDVTTGDVEALIDHNNLAFQTWWRANGAAPQPHYPVPVYMAPNANGRLVVHVQLRPDERPQTQALAWTLPGSPDEPELIGNSPFHNTDIDFSNGVALTVYVDGIGQVTDEGRRPLYAPPNVTFSDVMWVASGSAYVFQAVDVNGTRDYMVMEYGSTEPRSYAQDVVWVAPTLTGFLWMDSALTVHQSSDLETSTPLYTATAGTRPLWSQPPGTPLQLSALRGQRVE